MVWKKNISTLILAVILLTGFSVRLYKIDNPVADWHSWRQADTASVARNFLKFGFDPFHPRFDDLSNVASGLDNPQGWRMVEFPLYQTIGYIFYRVYSGLTIEVWLRLVSILSSLAAILFIYLLVAKYLNKLTALLSSSVFAFLPYAVYYSRTILPDMMATSLSIGVVYFLDKGIEYYSSNPSASLGINSVRSQKDSSQPLVLNNKVYYLLLALSALFAACSLLVKPTVGFLLLPIAYLFLKAKGIKAITSPSVYLYGLISLLPLILWRIFISHFPAGIPASDWLLNGGNIRFTGAFFHWILAERLGKIILGYGGLVFFFLGIALRPSKKEHWLFWILLVGTIFYVIVFARGNVQHDYYQILLLPAIAVFIAKGMSFLLISAKEYFSRLVSLLLVLVLVAITLAFSWFEVRGFYWINHPEIVEAGQAVDKLVPKDAKVIAPYGGDTAFLYQTKRQGWPVTEKSLPEMINMGANYIVIVNPDKEALGLAKTYPVVTQTPSFILLHLVKP